MFSSDEQLRHLSSAKMWYIDGTFKLCRHPFTQLFTINIFVRKDDCAKQVPMVFVLMSGRKSKDYKKVLQAINEALPVEPSVKTIVAGKGSMEGVSGSVPNCNNAGVCIPFHTSSLVKGE